MKICKKCGIEKELTEFGKFKRSKDGLSSWCKVCYKEYYQKNKDKIRENSKEWLENNKEYRKEYSKEYYEKNKDKRLEKSKEYYEKNKEMINKRACEYQKQRKNNDTLFKLKVNIRGLIRHSFKNKGYKKNTKTENILGCSFEEFKQHLESQFEDWMNWDNKGLYNGEFNYGWDIDHIIPLSSATTEEELIKLNHYTNLQPLCSYINRDIKVDNINYQK